MKKIDINFSSGGCLRGHSLDSHADGLSLFGNPPQGEEQTDVLSVVQEQRASGGLGFQEGFQSLDGFFHLTHKLINILFFKSITWTFLYKDSSLLHVLFLKLASAKLGLTTQTTAACVLKQYTF